MISSISNELSIFKSVGIGSLWLLYCFLSDIIFWVIIPHPWRLTFKDLFITYQPWITFAYLAIFISPIIVSLSYI